MADHYFSAEPSAASRRASVRLVLAGIDVELLSDRGVFSAGRVDAGTLALLRESPPPPAAGALLDLGCGYGAIACTLSIRSPGATVWAVDINSRALLLASDNAKRLGLKNLTVARPTDVPENIAFDGIWSNPPVRIGKTALHQLLRQWLPRLRPEAGAWLVVNRHLGGDSLASWLTVEGWAVCRAASKSGYRILDVHRPRETGARPDDLLSPTPSRKKT